jgi:propionate CoA-transferase
MELVFANKVACNFMPLAAQMHMIRARAGGFPGILTPVGLGTFVDPRKEGGRANSISPPSLSEVMVIDGKEYLFYRTMKMDVAFIRGTSADTKGNISIEREAVNFDQIVFAQAARSSGGIVIAQVERIVEAGSINPQSVCIPGIMVDYVVKAAPGNSPQSYGAEYDPSCCGEIRVPLDSLSSMEMDERKIISRRAALDLVAGAVVNLGVGVPEGVSQIMAEEGLDGKFTLSLEAGGIGGRPTGGLAFGAAVNPEAIINSCSILDFYDGGGIDFGCLGFAELDKHGNTNVSKFSGRMIGPGGYIDISQNAKIMLFCGSFTAGGLKIATGDGKLTIVQEGRAKKFVDSVEQVTYSGEYAASVGQNTSYITERAVFKLTPEGLLLTEIAPGVDLQRDVLDQMHFAPTVASDVKLMDKRIFYNKPMGLAL